MISQLDRNVRDTTQTSKRFHGLDRNRDGVVTRAVWRGNDNSFRQQDRNRDGVLTGSELRKDVR